MIRKAHSKTPSNRPYVHAVCCAFGLLICFCRGARARHEVHMLSYNNVGWTTKTSLESPEFRGRRLFTTPNDNNTSSIWGISLDPCAPTLLQRHDGRRRPYC